MKLRALDSAFMRHLGITVERIDSGRAELNVALAPELMNVDGIAHGGLIATLADSAAGAAVYSLLDESLIAVTTDLHITYLKPTNEGQLRAVSEVVHRGARFLHISVTVSQNNDVVAMSRASFMVVQRPRSQAPG
jgi:uncharacterized protein (TIGR00369 family)